MDRHHHGTASISYTSKSALMCYNQGAQVGSKSEAADSQENCYWAEILMSKTESPEATAAAAVAAKFKFPKNHLNFNYAIL